MKNQRICRLPSYPKNLSKMKKNGCIDGKKYVKRNIQQSNVPMDVPDWFEEHIQRTRDLNRKINKLIDEYDSL